MKITRLVARNWIGARDVDIAVPTPALLIAADNAQGKSSLREAIAAAFTGQLSRVKLKGDWGQLVNDATTEKVGLATVETDVGEATFTIPAGKWASETLKLAGGLKAPIKYVLDPAAFAALDDTEKRRFLAQFSTVPLTMTEVEARLVKRGIDAEMAKTATALVKAGGWDAAKDEASDKAKNFKGSWQTCTGKPRWGKDVGATWTVKIPEFDQDEFNRVVADITDTQARITEANQNIGGIKSRIQQIQASSNSVAAMRARAEAIPDLEDALATSQQAVENKAADLENATEAVMNASNKLAAVMVKPAQPAIRSVGSSTAGAPKGLDRLNVDEAEKILRPFLEVVNNSQGVAGYGSGTAGWGSFVFVAQAKRWLKTYEEAYGREKAKDVTPAPAVDPALKKAHDDAVAVATKASNACLTAEAAKVAAEKALQDAIADRDRLKEMGAAQTTDEAMGELQEAQALLERLQASLTGLQVQKGEMDGGAAAVAKAKKQATDAAQYHKAIVDWTACAEALSPDGIQAELVADSLKPFNDTLRTVSDLSGWPINEVKADMTMLYGGRLYGLCSKSERWRADFAYAVTIAILSGLKFVALDEVDILAPAERGKLVNCVDELIYQGMLDGAVLFATMKEAPKALPETFSGAWLSDGRATMMEFAVVAGE